MRTRSGLTYNSNDSNMNYYIQLGVRFRNWKNKVNNLCLNSFNMGCDDLPDRDYYTSFVENVTSEEMFQKISRDLYYLFMD